MILWSGVPFFQRALNDLVDDDTVFRMHADQTTALAGCNHAAKDCGVIYEEDTGIGHEHFETSYAFIHGGMQFFNLPVFEFSRNQMKAVVNRGFALCFLVPVIDSFNERFAFVLDGKVDDARCAAMRGGKCACAKIV